MSANDELAAIQNKVRELEAKLRRPNGGPPPATRVNVPSQVPGRPAGVPRSLREEFIRLGNYERF